MKIPGDLMSPSARLKHFALLKRIDQKDHFIEVALS
jgi:hypothetical protein